MKIDSFGSGGGGCNYDDGSGYGHDPRHTFNSVHGSGHGDGTISGNGSGYGIDNNYYPRTNKNGGQLYINFREDIYGNW